MITELLWKAVDELEHITDIEKENERLKQENEQVKQKLDWFLTETIAGKEYRPKEELEELQRENEQLKEKIEKMKCCHSCESHKLNDLKNCQTCDENYSKWEFAE